MSQNKGRIMINRNLLCGVTMCTLLTIGRIAGAQGPVTVQTPAIS